uniref:Uncharacterized protein n=1 Tax=Arundo donax TaxID=35708 RepID=A0A0A9E311_ARUDO
MKMRIYHQLFIRFLGKPVTYLRSGPLGYNHWAHKEARNSELCFLVLLLARFASELFPAFSCLRPVAVVVRTSVMVRASS